MNHTIGTTPVLASGGVDYVIVVGLDGDAFTGYHYFQEKVNRKLKDGYQLHGQPFIVNKTMCQSLMRYSEG